MQNSLRQSNNSLSPTLPVKDQYGRFDIGGPIGPGDIKNAMAADPQVQMGGNMLLDVTPVVESVRSVDRLPGQWQAYQEAENPIQQVLRAAEMALEGGALVADVIPHVKALGIGGAALIGLMARRTDEIEGIARFGLAKRQQGIIGYHGSPHKFDRFKHSQMGTGEGAQAYGWGTYIAENPDVAQSYRVNIGSPSKEFYIGGKVIPKNDIRFGIADDILSHGETKARIHAKANGPEFLRAFEEIKGKVQGDRAHLYEVDLHDEKIAQMLDWDAPLSEQHKKIIRENIDKFPDPRITQYMLEQEGITGGAVYGGIVSQYADNAAGSAKQHGSEIMKELGIPGIKYFDGNSRGAGQGTRNFVVFDENDLTILSRNGEAVGSKFRPITDDSVDGMRRYYSQRTWNTPEEAKNQIRNQIARDNEGYTIGGPTNPDIADRFEFVKSGNGYRIKQAPQKKAPIDVSNEPFEGLSMPDVDFNKADLADYNGEYNGYIRTDQLPKPKLAGGKTGYAWEEFDFKGGAFPPPTVKLNKNGTVSIVDGNHRIYRWMDEGMEQIPVKVIDSRNGESVLPRERMQIALPSGRKVGVSKNPTESELFGMKREAKESGGETLRNSVDADGNQYFWQADEAMHSHIEEGLRDQKGVKIRELDVDALREAVQATKRTRANP